MNQSSQTKQTTQQTASRIAYLQARWHADIVDEAGKAFAEEMEKLEKPAPAIDVFEVPGAFELPLQARMLGRTGRYACVVAAAFVVDGGIYRHEFVAETVVRALMQAQMETNVPVLSVVLTPHHFHETQEHRRFFLDHFKVKGREAAQACQAVLALREKIRRVA